MKYIQPEMEVVILEGIYTGLIIESAGTDKPLEGQSLTVEDDGDSLLQ